MKTTIEETIKEIIKIEEENLMLIKKKKDKDIADKIKKLVEGKQNED